MLAASGNAQQKVKIIFTPILREQLDDGTTVVPSVPEIQTILREILAEHNDISQDQFEFDFSHLGWNGNEDVKETLQKFTDDNQAPAKLLVVTHQALIKKLLVRDEQANEEKPIKFRVLAQNSEIYPFTFDFYDNIRADAREKDGSVQKEKKEKVPKEKKEKEPRVYKTRKTPNGDEP